MINHLPLIRRPKVTLCAAPSSNRLLVELVLLLVLLNVILVALLKVLGQYNVSAIKPKLPPLKSLPSPFPLILPSPLTDSLALRAFPPPGKSH